MNLSSNETYRGQQEKEKKSNRLEERRNHLAAILEAEKLTFQVFSFSLLLKESKCFRMNYHRFVNHHVNQFLI